ncbi:MAG: ABC transporter ATP-binding protein, partial [Acidimicrobiales bacterium]|nr:ABC transporter ATP-binding protein [Acidimicrobiales bacterium]
DEVLAVGDEEFRRRAIDRVAQLRQTGTTVMLVSHDWALIEQVCGRAIHIVEGHLVDDGVVSEVITRAGGTGETGGVQQLTGAVRLEPLVMPHRHVEFGGSLSFHGSLVVAEPSPHVRLEINYHVRGGPFGHPGTLDLEDEQVRTVFRRVVEPAPSQLAEPGRYDYSGTIDGHYFRGQFYVVLTAIDERDGLAIARTWTAITVGGRVTEEQPWLDLTAAWEVDEPPAPGAPESMRRTG